MINNINNTSNNNNNNNGSEDENSKSEKVEDIKNDGSQNDTVIPAEIHIERGFDLDDYLIEIGSLKKFQLINFFYVGIVMFLASALSLTYVFTAGDLNYRCVIPECDNGQSVYNPDWLIYAVPFEDDLPEQCESFRLVNETLGENGVCSADNFNRNAIVTCSDFIFETKEKTIVNEWNITCTGQKWKLSLAGSIEIAGAFFGLPLAGYVSDMYGRRFSFVAGMTGSAIFGTIRSFSWNYESFLVFEFLDPLFGGGVYPSVYILAIELVGPEYRVLFGALINVCYAIGEIILGVVAMFALDWRLLLRVLYIPGFLFISYIWLTPESVRWLLIKGKNEKAVKVLRKAASLNKAKLSQQTEQDLQDLNNRKLGLAGDNMEKSDAESNTYGLMEIFKFPTILIRIANCSFSWFSITFVYYGLSLLSTSIGGDKFINFILVCAIEIPAAFLSWWMNEKIGRKKTLAIAMIVSGLSCIGSTFVKDSQVFNLVLFLIGKFGISTAFVTIYIFTTEMFPTNLRQSLLSICSTVGRLGNILAPQAPLLSIVFTDLPMYCFGGVVLISGLCGLYFPETLNKRLPNTLEEAVTLDSIVPDKNDVENK